MRIFLFIWLLLITFSSVYAQDVNCKITDEQINEEILIGYCNFEGLQSQPFAVWFEDQFSNYEPDRDVIDEINSQKLSSLQIIIVLGTWCGDSKREVPRFFNILDVLGMDLHEVKMIAVNTYKMAENTNVSRYNIKKVPTFIFLDNGNEIGRIVETPEKTLEKDIVKILSEY